jgi:hypothetical protein
MPTYARPKMHTVFHADLSDAHPGEEYWLHAMGKKYALIAHTPETLAKARAGGAAALASVCDEHLTHYTQMPVYLPADRVVRVHLKHTMKTFPGAGGETGVSHCAIHIPPAAALKGAHGTPETAMHTAINYVTTAQGLMFHHADLINVDPTTTTTIYGYMTGVKAISDQFQSLALIMRQMGPPTENSGWANLLPFTPPASDLKGCDGKTTYYMQQPTQDLMTQAGPVMTSMMQATKNDLTLAGVPPVAGGYKKWTLQPGTSVQAPAANRNNAAGMEALGSVEALGDGTWQAALANTGTVTGLTATISVLSASNRQISLTFNNTYIRYLAGYIQFLDASNNPVSVPSWSPDDPGIIYKAMTVGDIQYDDLRFLGYIGPVDNVMAIPIAADPGVLQVNITFPPNAVKAMIYGSGLGTGSDLWPKTPIVGGLLTGLLNLGVPAFMLAFGAAAQSYKPLYDIVNTLSSNNAFVSVVVIGGVAFFGGQFGVSAYHKQMNWKAFSTLSQLLFNQAATKLLLWVEVETAGEAAADEIPFAGWIMLALNIGTGIAQMAETIVEVATSDWNIGNSISLTVTTNVTIHPDPRHRAFPQGPAGDAVTYDVKMIFQDQNRPTVTVTGSVPAGTTPTTLQASFPGNTLGGQVKFEADFYIGTWLAGKATTGFMGNNVDDVTQVDVFLIQFPIPLTAKSVYLHTSLLTYQNGNYQWQPTANVPTGTIANANTSSTGNAISLWTGLALSQRYGMLGAAWKAAGMGITSCVSGQGGQLFAMQNVDIPGEPMNSVIFPVCGLDGSTLLVYDPYPPKFQMNNGQWVIGPDGNPVPDPADTPLGEYYVDPRKASNDPSVDGGYHLRSVTLSPATPFNMGSNLLSYGRMLYPPDSMALHPSGHYIAVNSQYARIMIGSLQPGGVADTDLPLANVYSGQAQAPDRPGLLFHPVAVSCANDGTIFILEDTKSAGSNNSVVLARVQSFDLNGNPVNRFFDDNGNPGSFLNLSTTGSNTYLDIAAVGDPTMTYLYVLYYTGDGTVAADYNMSIYQYGKTAPATNPLVTTPNIPAARVAVDMWHTAYTLNYDMVTDGKGNPAGPKNATTGPGGRTVPSISEWLPPVPTK